MKYVLIAATLAIATTIWFANGGKTASPVTAQAAPASPAISTPPAEDKPSAGKSAPETPPPAADDKPAPKTTDSADRAQPQPDDWRAQLSATGATLGDVRRIFLHKQVTVLGAVADNIYGQTSMLGWDLAVPAADGGYVGKSGLDRFIPASYRGKTAEVMAIELDRRPAAVNALGEAVSEDRVTNPYFHIVIRFDDGTLATTTAFPNTLSGELDLAAGASQLVDRIHRELPQLIGKTVYVAQWAPLWQPNTSLEEMTKIGIARHSKLEYSEMPRFQPLRITAAKYIDSEGVVFKLQLPGGKEALYLQPGEHSPP
jgi:hypothetical protein